MTKAQYYGFIGGFVSIYTLGHMHAKDHTHWKNIVMALVAGLAWPVVIGYAVYSVHFKH